jgi:ElaB/YqjD/DUF883 family membrane-anchored ribosome-binding protein
VDSAPWGWYSTLSWFRAFLSLTLAYAVDTSQGGHLGPPRGDQDNNRDSTMGPWPKNQMEASMINGKQTGTHNDLGMELPGLKEQLEQLNAAIENATKLEGGEAVKAIGEAARDMLARASDLVDELAKNVADMKSATASGRDYLENAIRKQPLVFIAIAAAAGFLVASLRRR